MRAGVIPQFSNDPAELIDAAPVFSGPLSPHFAVDAGKIAVLYSKFLIILYLRDEFLFRHTRPLPASRVFLVDAIRIVVPNVDVVVDEVFDICLSRHEPIQLMQNTLPVNFFGCEQWKSLREIESYLTAEKAIVRFTMSGIDLSVSRVEEFPHQVEVLIFGMARAHMRILPRLFLRGFPFSGRFRRHEVFPIILHEAACSRI